MIFRLAIFSLPLFFVIQMPVKALADKELWAVYEHRIPLVRSAPQLPRLSLRVATETVFGTETALQTALLRAGPMIDITSWLYVAAHGVVLTTKVGQNYEPRYRAEFELNPYGRLGPFRWNDRLRNEMTFGPGMTPEYRLREMFRLSLPLAAKPEWVPFVAVEAFITPMGKQSVSEVRNLFGVGYKLGSDTRMDLGYCLRNRYGAQGWEIDHALFVVFLFDVPRKVIDKHTVN
jgi:hypothetical protein